jgi:hypothetical protein
VDSRAAELAIRKTERHEHEQGDRSIVSASMWSISEIFPLFGRELWRKGQN